MKYWQLCSLIASIYIARSADADVTAVLAILFSITSVVAWFMEEVVDRKNVSEEN